jgi:hypothetical protein
MPSWPKKQQSSPPESPEPPVQPSAWQLPGGQSLAEFAMRSGIVAPKLLSTPRRSSARRPANSAPASGKAKEDVA